MSSSDSRDWWRDLQQFNVGRMLDLRARRPRAKGTLYDASPGDSLLALGGDLLAALDCKVPAGECARLLLLYEDEGALLRDVTDAQLTQLAKQTNIVVLTSDKAMHAKAMEREQGCQRLLCLCAHDTEINRGSKLLYNDSTLSSARTNNLVPEQWKRKLPNARPRLLVCSTLCTLLKKKSKSYDLSHDFGAAFKERRLDAAVYEASCVAEDLEHLLALLPIHCSIAHHGRAEGDRAAVADAPLEDVDKSPLATRKRQRHEESEERKRQRREESEERTRQRRAAQATEDACIQRGFTANHLFDDRALHSTLAQLDEQYERRLPRDATVCQWAKAEESLPLSSHYGKITVGEACRQLRDTARRDDWLCHLYRCAVSDQADGGGGLVDGDEAAETVAAQWSQAVRRSAVLRALTEAMAESGAAEGGPGPSVAAVSVPHGAEAVQAAASKTPLFEPVVFKGLAAAFSRHAPLYRPG